MPHPLAFKKSALGMDGNLAALLGYLFWPIALVNLIAEKENQFVRFHAVQKLFFILFNLIAFFVLFFAFFILSFVIMIIAGVATAAAGDVGGIIGFLISLIAIIIWAVLPLLFALIILLGLILCMVKAYQGEPFKLPIVGRFASKVVPL
jgi:uncharacterized membrane protein